MNSAYNELGVSSSKEDVHNAVRKAGIRGRFPHAFCNIHDDVLTGDPNKYMVQHEDGPGSKVLQNYIHYKETDDATWFEGTAVDAIIMNTDDVICVGATGSMTISDVINRNRHYIPSEVIDVIIGSFKKEADRLGGLGVSFSPIGGETACLPDQVRTITVDATLTTIFPSEHAITAENIADGDIIIGLASAGRANYEFCENSGIRSNGLTFARHVLMKREYLEKYPETVDPENAAKGLCYRGTFSWDDYHDKLGMTVGEALTCQTRTYMPVVFDILEHYRESVHGMAHNTGGGLTKCLRLGNNIHYIKNDLIDVPPIFRLVQKEAKEPWNNMLETLNCGIGFEIIADKEAVDDIIGISEKHGIEAKAIGYCEKTDSSNTLTIESEHGKFAYALEA